MKEQKGTHGIMKAERLKPQQHEESAPRTACCPGMGLPYISGGIVLQ